jgi:hypothetical protein
MAGGVAQVVEHLPSKSSSPTPKKKKKPTKLERCVAVGLGELGWWDQSEIRQRTGMELGREASRKSSCRLEGSWVVV